MLKADFHIHTHYSRCSNMKPKNIVKVALKKGYDIIGIVDHNCIKGGLITKSISGKKILVIPGEEIMTDCGEVIVFLSDGKYNKSLLDVCERARNENHFLIAPHPFDFLRANSIKNNLIKIKELDAIEVFNSRVLINRFNKIAENYAEKNKIPKIVGSDAHFLEEIGNVNVFLNCDKNIDSIFDCIKRNEFNFYSKRCSVFSHFKSNVVLPIKRII